ncbi:hypothetical protein QBC43DRAFT_315260 [Cladorrhinum sp. PSN259]|nr:hypothetical protein QBC43DRAFT_315260 [Cladorrhinum sp. PSN259]
MVLCAESFFLLSLTLCVLRSFGADAHLCIALSPLPRFLQRMMHQQDERCLCRGRSKGIGQDWGQPSRAHRGWML